VEQDDFNKEILQGFGGFRV